MGWLILLLLIALSLGALRLFRVRGGASRQVRQHCLWVPPDMHCRAVRIYEEPRRKESKGVIISR